MKQADLHDERAQELARDHQFQTPSVTEVTSGRSKTGPPAPNPGNTNGPWPGTSFEPWRVEYSGCGVSVENGP